MQKGPDPSALGDPCSQGGAESKQYDLLAGEMQCTGWPGLAIVCAAESTQRRAVCCHDECQRRIQEPWWKNWWKSRPKSGSVASQQLQ